MNSLEVQGNQKFLSRRFILCAVCIAAGIAKMFIPIAGSVASLGEFIGLATLVLGIFAGVGAYDRKLIQDGKE